MFYLKTVLILHGSCSGRFAFDLKLISKLNGLLEELLGVTSDLLGAASWNVILDFEPIFTEILKAYNKKYLKISSKRAEQKPSILHLQ